MDGAWRGFSLVSHSVPQKGGPRTQPHCVHCVHPGFFSPSFADCLTCSSPFLSSTPSSPFLSFPIVSFAAPCLHSVQSHVPWPCCSYIFWYSKKKKKKSQNSPLGLFLVTSEQSVSMTFHTGNRLKWIFRDAHMWKRWMIVNLLLDKFSLFSSESVEQKNRWSKQSLLILLSVRLEDAACCWLISHLSH